MHRPSLRAIAALATALAVVASDASAQSYRPSFEKSTLPNGLELVLLPDSTLPEISVNLAVRGGSARDPKGRFGLANVCGSLLFGITAEIPPASVSRIRTEFGVRTACITNVDWSDYFATYPPELLDTALWIESDRMRAAQRDVEKPAFDGVIGETVRNARQRMRRPLGDIDATVYEEIYPVGHPYRHTSMGDTTNLKAITPPDVNRFLRLFFIPPNASLTIGGHFDPARAKALVAKYFSDIPGGKAIRWNTSDRTYERPDTALIVREAETQYAQFQIVFPAAPAGHPDVAALRMATKILAGSENGRLQRDLYATSRNVLDVTATYSAQELDGLVYVTVLCRPEADLQDLYDRVMKGIASMRDAEPSDLELQMGRNLAEMEYFTPLENLGGFGGRADAVNLANLMTGDPASGFDMVTGMAQVSPFAIRRVADTYFDPAHAVVVCIVPTGSLRKAIRTL